MHAGWRRVDRRFGEGGSSVAPLLSSRSGRARRTHALLALTEYLRDPEAAPVPPVSLLEQARLASYVYTQLDPGHPARPHLLPALLTGTTAHETAKAAVSPLLRAWHEAGIEVLAFKGFALALTTYEHAGQRFYEDLDLLIRPGDAAMAERLARERGWSVRWSAARAGNAYAHEALHLLSPDGLLMIDVHRLILHSYAPWQRRLRSLTEAAWAASQVVPLGGTSVRVLDPPDAVLIGLVLNRAWSTDGWRLKPRDYVDFRAIVERHGVTKAALVERARELRCERTLARFLQRCDPFEGRIELRTPSRPERLRWSLAVAHERRPYWLDHALNLPLIAPGVIRDVFRELSGLLRVLRLLRRERGHPAAPAPRPGCGVVATVERAATLPSGARGALGTQALAGAA